MKARHMYSRVGIEADLETMADARQATKAVLQTLRDRLTPDEARHAAAQLPAELKRMWMTDDRRDRRPLKLHRREFYDRVKRQADLPTVRKAELVTDAVFAALKEQLSEGEADDILTQLPRDLKSVWVHA